MSAVITSVVTLQVVILALTRLLLPLAYFGEVRRPFAAAGSKVYLHQTDGRYLIGI